MSSKFYRGCSGKSSAKSGDSRGFTSESEGYAVKLVTRRRRLLRKAVRDEIYFSRRTTMDGVVMVAAQSAQIQPSENSGKEKIFFPQAQAGIVAENDQPLTFDHSLKRALARSKQHIPTTLDQHKFRSHKSRSGHTKKRKNDSKRSNEQEHNDHSAEKKAKLHPLQGTEGLNMLLGETDPNGSNHVVAMTQLKETIASLQKQVAQKDSALLTKDKLITELKAQSLTNKQDLQNEMKNRDRVHEIKFNLMTSMMQNLLKEVATKKAALLTP